MSPASFEKDAVERIFKPALTNLHAVIVFEYGDPNILARGPRTVSECVASL